MIQCTMLRCKSTLYYDTYGSWAGHIGTNGKQLVPGQGASSIQPGLLHPENQQLPTSRLFINHALWSYHANLAHGSTSHSVRDVELDEKDTEGGDKDKVQLDDLTDRVIVWLT